MLTQTDRQIVEQKWVETGRSLPAVSPRYLPAHRPRRPQPILADQEDQITRIINRCLVDMLGTTMAQVNPLARVGRVVVCELIPIRRYDPIMPVPVVHMSGWRRRWHHRTYDRLIDYLIWYRERLVYWDHSPAGFVRRARPLVQRLPKLAAPYLHADELAYYSDQLLECLTNPLRLSMAELRQGRGR
jgi:hypothetical protein